MIAERYFKVSSYALVGSGCASAAFAGLADIFSLLCFAAAFLASWFFDTARLRRRLAPWGFAAVAFVYLCFIPVDYVWLSRAWAPALLHLLWFALAVQLLTRAGDRDWPRLYLPASLQWIPAATQPVSAPFWSCFALFVVSGTAALMLYEVRRPLGNRDAALRPAEGHGTPRLRASKPNIKFPSRTFSLTAAGITLAVLAGAVPLFFFFPRLSASGAPAAAGAASPVSPASGSGVMLGLGHGGFSSQSDAVVMRVRTDISRERLPYDLKWRGLAFDHYDGRTWTLRRRAPQAVATQGRFYKLEESALGSELLRQTFFMEDISSSTVFAAHQALAVSLNIGPLQRDTAGNLFASHAASGDVNYVTVSDVIRPDAEKIPERASAPREIYTAYLQLPPLDPRIGELARSVTQGQESRYARARALEAWLRTRYAYSRIPLDVPENSDPLAFFLFDAQAGNCEYFATALTVMLRQTGVPARMTSGFLAGEYNAVSGSWTVRRHHAHAWTEAWFPPYGWVEFDPTPPAPAETRSATAQFFANLADAAEFWWRENVVSYDSSRQYSLVSGFFSGVNRWEDRAGTWLSAAGNRAAPRRLFSRTPLAALVTIFLVLSIAVLVILCVRPWRSRLSGGIRRFKERKHPQAAITGFYAEALKSLQSRGFVRQKSQTPMEFARSLGHHPAATALSDLTRLYNEVRFGHPVAPFPRAEAQRLLDALRASLKIGNGLKCQR